MIKLTHFDSAGRRDAVLYVAIAHIVSMGAANPSGTLIVTTRAAYHVAQSLAQVLTLMEGESK